MGSTGAMVLSFIVSFTFLFTSAKFLGEGRFAWLSLVAYFGGMVLGGVAGAVGGILIAARLNRLFGLSRP